MSGKGAPRRLLPIGARFGRLEVIENVLSERRTTVRCRCECENEWIGKAYSLTGAHTTSCGCAKRGVNATHGMSGTAIYRVWKNMRRRCETPGHRDFRHYGGRGIVVCAEWKDSASAFIEWAMSHGYAPGLEIDRRDNDGPYTPSNCRFVTRKINCGNRHNAVNVTIDGTTKSLAEWADETGLNYHTLFSRLQRGWPTDKLLVRAPQ
jgi:hypothetical protein